MSSDTPARPLKPARVPRCIQRTKRTLDFYIARQTRCQICGSRKRLVLDHDHFSGLARGVLCQTCNTAVGFVECQRKRGTYDALLRYIDSFGLESLEHDKIHQIVLSIESRWKK